MAEGWCELMAAWLGSTNSSATPSIAGPAPQLQAHSILVSRLQISDFYSSHVRYGTQNNVRQKS